ncbi:MAG: hypothetical protein ACI82S_001682, partial [Patiriisocius sp.]
MKFALFKPIDFARWRLKEFLILRPLHRPNHRV